MWDKKYVQTMAEEAKSAVTLAFEEMRTLYASADVYATEAPVTSQHARQQSKLSRSDSNVQGAQLMGLKSNPFQLLSPCAFFFQTSTNVPLPKQTVAMKMQSASTQTARTFAVVMRDSQEMAGFVKVRWLCYLELYCKRKLKLRSLFWLAGFRFPLFAHCVSYSS